MGRQRRAVLAAGLGHDPRMTMRLLLAALLTAGVVAPGAASPADAELQRVVRESLADAEGRGADAPQLVSATRVVWRDGSLGCPQPDRAYTQALVPGYRVLVRAGDQVLDYHASLRGPPRLCPAGRARDPLPGGDSM